MGPGLVDAPGPGAPLERFCRVSAIPSQFNLPSGASDLAFAVLARYLECIEKRINSSLEVSAVVSLTPHVSLYSIGPSRFVAKWTAG